MSRLVEDDIRPIKSGMEKCEKEFKRQTKYSMLEIAARAAGYENINRKKVVAVVSITSGLGIIGGFAEAVCEILQYYNITAFVTDKTDIEGIFEAYQKKADIIFAADDNCFIAYSTESNAVAENGECTGKGFAEALISIADTRDRKVLILGAGPVGRSAMNYFLEQNYSVDLFDVDVKKAIKAGKNKEKVKILYEMPDMNEYTNIYDATTAKEIITSKDITKNTVIAAPGMPCGISPEAQEIARVIHNPLELGVLTMYFECVKKSQMQEDL